MNGTAEAVLSWVVVVAAAAIWGWLFIPRIWRQVKAWRAGRRARRHERARRMFEAAVKRHRAHVVTDTGIYRWSTDADAWRPPVEPGKHACVQDVKELRQFATIAADLMVQDPEFASRIRRINP